MMDTRSILAAAAAVALTFIHNASASTDEPRFEVANAEVLAGDPVGVRITGLEPGALVLVTTQRAYGRSSTLYRTNAAFRADEDGVIDAIGDAPITGPWRGSDPCGLFWTMRNTGEPAPDNWSRDEVRFYADVDGDGAHDIDTLVRLRQSIDGLVETPLGDAFPGAFLMRPPGDEPLPAIVVLGGSEGGDGTARSFAPRIASRGYAVVGFPYYGSGDAGTPLERLPSAFHNIPLDDMERVRDWLRARDDIRHDRIGLWGVSKGAEFVLAASSRIDGFAAVAAIVPSDVIWEGWGFGTTPGQSSCFSWRGEPLDFVPYLGFMSEFSKGRRGIPVKIRIPQDAGRLANAESVEAARIRVEDIDEPVFLVAGDGDDVWDSGGMARNIKENRDAAGLETQLILNTRAGHYLSGDAYVPLREQYTAAVRREAFPAMLAFFERWIKSGESPG